MTHEPHDVWIVGEGLEEPGRWYAVHTGTPRFIAEICDEDEAGIGGIQWVLANGQIAQNIVFYDEPPTGEALDALIFRLGEVLETYDDRVEGRNQRARDDEEDEV